ncbi:GMC oxidoreductase [Calocera cornea HHB12733]|uniref:GMC oxidoreductase n=1 Tax=Calocera cornea HHB12733 TaxID=1353952 RepID=A0A165J8D4_9BASI|nr:GMC oxidoreductase [Calocera cornea HHB12733]
MSAPTPVPTLASLEDVSDQTFDYVICGGGTAGLTLAARLSVRPELSVLVLEAGLANFEDPLLLATQSGGGQLAGNPKYDWMLKTTPQKNCFDKSFEWARGKTLGGSSAINMMVYMRPPPEDINAWEELGNKGWNWSNHFKYSTGSESNETEGITVFPYTGKMPLDEQILEAFGKHGLPALSHPLDGNINGTWITKGSLDPKTRTRSYAVTGYYLPNAHRSNLTVLTGANVNRLIYVEQAPGADITAEGVVFSYEGKPYHVKAKKEVILSAGALKSPQLLELSGIGSPELLEPLGIPCKVDLPGVGANLQEHTFFGTFFELSGDKLENTADGANLKDEETTLMGFARYAFAPFQRISPAASKLIADLEQKLEGENKAGKFSASLWEQYQIQLRHLKDANAPDAEIMIAPLVIVPWYPRVPGKIYLSLFAGLNQPFSRGSTHINSIDPKAPPTMDPNYFDEEFDLQLLVEELKFLRELGKTEPFASFMEKEIVPGPHVTSDKDLGDYIKKGMMTTWHTAGTCSMLPREKDGVVDAQLKVYGTTNVRVVDLSIVPLHVASHTKSIAYAIAEQAADIILGLA